MQWFADHWPLVQIWLVTVFSSIFAALGAVGITFKYFGEQIISHIFDRKIELFKHERARDLEQFKHPLNQEIERLRGDLSHLSDRGKHSNEREYSAASLLWDKAVDLYFATNMCVISYIEYPPLNAMPQEELLEFLNTTEFSESQKRLVLDAHDKERSFSHITGRRHINAARNEVSLMNAVLHKQGIFVPSDLCDAFEAFKELCIRAIAQRHTEHGENFRTGLQHDLEFLQQGPPHLDVVKAIVRKRLLRE